ncbi:TIGR03752 family integrating conjugative element protein [Paraburkholderia ginsengisoli]|uniref:TIGR03752 family integrating conjugative element protein n=1 Tax=Paraburkholderia ginsengisoli TaxID=311231 RepID=A0A7T4N325_9BURK|nr:TIGR03752 family integrating conjugative element protein [Paraburkholderia ginsengisoli]QQC64345.1 TIGR03752 family integrating conjugative element protein [Paraburkholderia ginsengisoli]
MKSNGLLKWLMLPVALLVIFVGIKLFSGHAASTAAKTTNSNQLTPDEMKALGIEGDTPRDTVATLVGQVKQLRGELQTALTDNKDQKAENERLHQRESDIDQRVQSALNGEHDRLKQDSEQAASDKQQTQSLLQDMQHRLDGLGNRTTSSDLPVGLGLQDGDGKNFAGDSLTWIDPQDTKPSDRQHTASGTSSSGSSAVFPTSFGPAQTSLDQPGETVRHHDHDTGEDTGTDLTPVYTIPANATLIGSVAMTALIGRVPIDGTVNDPYPFKVLIGPDNLTANGIDLPDVAGAVVSGTASGDWTLSCVRGQIRSVTFVFRDGTVRTVPENAGEQNSSTDNTTKTGNGPIQGGLGWISDPYGVPCVSGEQRSNATQYLGSQALITAAGAGAASLIKSDNGSVSYMSNSNGSLGTVGISGNEAMGRILAGGVEQMSQWVNKLYGQAFAAIYVPPGARIAVHIDRALNIDYAPKGRRINYRLGDSHASELD